MNYPKCSQFHSNYKKESDIMRCLNEGRQFACLGIYKDIVFDNPSKLLYHPKTTSGINIFFKEKIGWYTSKSKCISYGNTTHRLQSLLQRLQRKSMVCI